MKVIKKVFSLIVSLTMMLCIGATISAKGYDQNLKEVPLNTPIRIIINNPNARGASDSTVVDYTIDYDNIEGVRVFISSESLDSAIKIKSISGTFSWTQIPSANTNNKKFSKSNLFANSVINTNFSTGYKYSSGTRLSYNISGTVQTTSGAVNFSDSGTVTI